MINDQDQMALQGFCFSLFQHYEYESTPIKHSTDVRACIQLHWYPFSHKSTHFPQMDILMQQITNFCLLTLNGLRAQKIFLNDMLHQLVTS